jgi:hypothetical protein
MPSRSASSAMVANSPDSSILFQRKARASALTGYCPLQLRRRRQARRRERLKPPDLSFSVRSVCAEPSELEREELLTL